MSLTRAERLELTRLRRQLRGMSRLRLHNHLTDRELWVLTRLVPGKTAAQTLARTRKLEIAYNAMTQHHTPTVARYGQRLSERAHELWFRGVGRA